jgi:hypothetical protein
VDFAGDIEVRAFFLAILTGGLSFALLDCCDEFVLLVLLLGGN